MMHVTIATSLITTILLFSTTFAMPIQMPTISDIPTDATLNDQTTLIHDPGQLPGFTLPSPLDHTATNSHFTSPAPPPSPDPSTSLSHDLLDAAGHHHPHLQPNSIAGPNDDLQSQPLHKRDTESHTCAMKIIRIIDGTDTTVEASYDYCPDIRACLP